MREVRAAVAAGRAAQDDPSDEVDVSFDVRLRALMADLPLDPRLARQLFHPSNDWNLDADAPAVPERAWPLAWARLVRPLVQLYTDHPLRRQAQLNVYLVTLLRRSYRETVRLQLEVQTLRRRP
jgi:hypothetical protein